MAEGVVKVLVLVAVSEREKGKKLMMPMGWE